MNLKIERNRGKEGGNTTMRQNKVLKPLSMVTDEKKNENDIHRLNKN